MSDETKIRCALDIGDIAPEAYRLPTDGRQWLHLCKQRASVAGKMALKANPDGTSIMVSASTLARLLGIKSLHTVNDLIKDLHTLNFLFDTGFSPKYKTIVRRLDVAAIQAAAPKKSSTNEDCSPEQASTENAAHLSNLDEAPEQSTKAPEQSTAVEPAKIAHYRLFLPPSSTALLPPPEQSSTNGRVGVGFITKNSHVWGLPSPKQVEGINTLVAKHSKAVVLGALKKFRNRHNGFEKLTHPWAVWETEGPKYIALLEDEERQAKARAEASLSHIKEIDESVAHKAAAHAAFMLSSPPVNEGEPVTYEDVAAYLAVEEAAARAFATKFNYKIPAATAPQSGGIEDFLENK
jgi:hypothetical protein